MSRDPACSRPAATGVLASRRKSDGALHLEAQGRVCAALRRPGQGLLQSRRARRRSRRRLWRADGAQAAGQRQREIRLRARGVRRASGEPGPSGQGGRALPDQGSDGGDLLPRRGAQEPEGSGRQAAGDIGGRNLRRHARIVHPDQQCGHRQDPADPDGFLRPHEPVPHAQDRRDVGLSQQRVAPDRETRQREVQHLAGLGLRI